MKRIVFFIALCISLVSCDSNDDNDALPVDGQYIAETNSMLFSMQLVGGECTGLTIFNSGEYFSQTRDVSTSGGYPKYKYTAGSLTFQAKFSDVDKFNASISGGASSEDGRTHWVIDGPATFLFSLDNRVLDANGDGILDTVQ